MAKYTFELLNPPNTIQGNTVNATALNNQGDVVGSGWGTDYPDGKSSCADRTILWKSTGGSEVVAADCGGMDINDEGEILCVGMYNGTFAWVYRIKEHPSGQLHPIQPFPGGPYAYVDAMAINRNGIVTGRSESDVFFYDSRAGNPMKSLGFGSTGFAINNQYQVAAMAMNLPFDGTGRAFLIEDVDSATSSTRQLGEVRRIRDMNDSGEVVGMRIADGASEPTAYLCKTSGGIADFHDLGVLPGYTRSDATAINSTGDVVGNCYSDDKGSPHGTVPFLRLASGGMQDVNSLDRDDTSWHLQTAVDINEQGQIVGMCKGGDGVTAAYLLTPIPNVAFDYQRLLGELYSMVGGTDTSVWFGPGTRPVPIDPNPRVVWDRLSTGQQDILIGIAVGTLASFAQARSREEIERSAIGLMRKALAKLS